MKRLHDKKRLGIAAVEFALVFPIILILSMGVLEVGNMMFSWLTLQKAAQEGTRMAITGQGDEEGTRIMLIEDAAERLLVDLNHGTKEITIKSWPGVTAGDGGATGNPGRPCQLMEVSILYKYKPFVPVINKIFPEVIPLEASDRKVNEPWEPCD